MSRGIFAIANISIIIDKSHYQWKDEGMNVREKEKKEKWNEKESLIMLYLTNWKLDSVISVQTFF